jgi:hypothetical protein
MIRDTDRLVNHLKLYRGEYLQRSGIIFSNYRSHNQPVNDYNVYISRVARFVLDLRPEWFYYLSRVTKIIGRLINGIRALDIDVPINYIQLMSILDN